MASLLSRACVQATHGPTMMPMQVCQLLQVQFAMQHSNGFTTLSVPQKINVPCLSECKGSSTHFKNPPWEATRPDHGAPPGPSNGL